MQRSIHPAAASICCPREPLMIGVGAWLPRNSLSIWCWDLIAGWAKLPSAGNTVATPPVAWSQAARLSSPVVGLFHENVPALEVMR